MKPDRCSSIVAGPLLLSVVGLGAGPASARAGLAAAMERAANQSPESSAHIGTGDPSPSELVALVDGPTHRARRGAAAELLRRASAATDAPAERLVALLAAGDAAVRLLDHGTTARLIELDLLAARGRALVDREAAAAQLCEALARWIRDLSFEPIPEAPMPLDFPPPTPIHEIELKRYPAYRMATTSMRRGSNGAFWTLFGHIRSSDIPMTAPVETTFESDGERLRAEAMAFLYETPERGEAGNRGAVDVVDSAAQWVVSIGLCGYDTPARIAAARAELIAWVAARSDLEVAGELRTMGYNGPSVIGNRRLFEVQIPVRVQGAAE